MAKLAAAATLAWGVLLILPLLLIAGLAGPDPQACVPGMTSGGAVPALVSSASGLTEDQLANAAAVIQEGRRRAVPDQGIVIALATALQESGLRIYANDGLGGDLAADQVGIARSLDLPHEAVGTDHGSLGIFQQQWPWWGDMNALMDPSQSASLFYAALSHVPNWQALPVTVAAQAVQSSRYPDAYADDEPLARRLLAELGNGIIGTAVDCAALMTGGTVVYPLPSGSGYVDQRNFGISGSNWSSWHTGTDLSVACGTPVLAAHGGIVNIETDQSWAGPWLVQVQTAPGQLTTWYAHMRRVTVPDGATVQPGQQLGEVGDLGNATGCHLHFEVHPHGGSIYEDPVDPTTWLANHVGKPLHSAGIRVASFNVLGDSHTQPGGENPGMASGAVRIRRALQILEQHHVDIAGLQEFQRPQARAFAATAREAWGTFNARTTTANTIVWRTATWQLVEGRLVSVPYFYGHREPMPLVLLRHRASGQLLWVFDVHNPASTPRYGDQERWRDAATAIELRTVRAVTSGSDVPLVFTGDFNERYEAYCRLSRSHVLTAAPGNSGGCDRPPWDGIDWIFGSPSVYFSDWRVDRGALVQSTTDHPFVMATVEIG